MDDINRRIRVFQFESLSDKPGKAFGRKKYIPNFNPAFPIFYIAVDNTARDDYKQYLGITAFIYAYINIIYYDLFARIWGMPSS